jgi:hypothetical protein
LGSHHDDDDPDKDSDEVGEEGERMLDVVHVAAVRPLDDLLRVVHHVPQEDQQAKVNLRAHKQFHVISHSARTKEVKTAVVSVATVTVLCYLSYLKHEDVGGVAKDGCGELQPNQD